MIITGPAIEFDYETQSYRQHKKRKSKPITEQQYQNNFWLKQHICKFYAIFFLNGKKNLKFKNWTMWEELNYLQFKLEVPYCNYKK